MKKTAIRGLKTAILSLALAGLIALPALAQEGAIKYRQSVMKAVGGHMAAMGAILKGTGGQARDLKVHADAMAALATVAANAAANGIELINWSSEERRKYREVAASIWAEYATRSPMAQRIYDSHMAFLTRLGLLGAAQ